MTPHTAKPAPNAITRIESVLTASEKNSTKIDPFQNLVI